MPKLLRKTQKIFGSNTINLGRFGSAQTGFPILSPATDLADMQSLPAYENGWGDAVISGKKRPPLEEENTAKYINDYQNAYQFQEGIAEYDAGTTYFIGSIAKQVGTSIVFKSLIDNNLGNPLVNGANWKLAGDLVDMRNANQLQGFDIDSGTPVVGDYLRYDGTVWQHYLNSNAAMYFNSNATLTPLTVNVPTKIVGTYIDEELIDFTHLGGRLTYTGTILKRFVVNCTLSYDIATNNRLSSCYIAKNGVVINKTKKRTSSGTSGTGTTIDTFGIISLAANDYIEVFIENNTNSDDATVFDLYCLITEL